METPMTPAQIDTAWAPIDSRRRAINRQVGEYREWIAEAKSDLQRARYERSLDDYLRSTAVERECLAAATVVLEQVFTEAGGWNRYFLCATDGGHVHHLPCSTLRPSTQIAWMPGLSGLDENGMVEAVGFKACTVCFSTAPVHPAWARTEAAARKATADERSAKWQKGLEVRTKKVANIEKRIAKAQRVLDDPASAEWDRSSARHDLEWDSRELGWAKREVERWMGKQPAVAA